MKRPRELVMRSAYVHPEFGYFCPSKGLRRIVRVAFAFAVIGALAGAGGVGALIADHESNLEGGVAASAEARGTDAQQDAGQPAVKAEASPIVTTEHRPFRPSSKAHSVRSDATRSSSAKSDEA